eukprot:gene50490-61771_t
MPSILKQWIQPMSDEREQARVRVDALAPQYQAGAAQWAARLGLPLDGEADFALQLGDDGLQLVDLSPQAPGPVRVDFVEGAAAHRRQFGGGAGQMIAKAVGVPVLANITEFGATPLFTVDELRTADVGLVLYPLSAFRAMNKAAENVYGAIRRDGTQQGVLDTMQTRQELYERINYHDFEQKLDALRPQMTEQAPTFKPKKSVALSGVTAGNTALCSVGKTGNDLHYR